MRIPLTLAATSLLVLPFAPGAAYVQSEEPVRTGTEAAVVTRSPETTPTVVELRAAPHEGYDRVVFELDGPLPGYRVEYVDVVREPPPSDAPVELGGEAALQVTIDPATAQDDDGLTFSPGSLRPQLRSVREVQYAGDGDQRAVFGIGVARERPFRVLDLENPTRLVVDVARSSAGPTTTTTDFGDDDGLVHEEAIQALAKEGVTRGCDEAAERFCPHDHVLRGQMAALLARALDLPASDADAFRDDDASVHEDAVNALAAAGVTGGCADGAFARPQP